jgi:hypothetical protein
MRLEKDHKDFAWSHSSAKAKCEPNSEEYISNMISQKHHTDMMAAFITVIKQICRSENIHFNKNGWNI